MKITEETKIKDLIPEGMSLYKDGIIVEKETTLTGELFISIKLAVRDCNPNGFDWYVSRYLLSIRHNIDGEVYSHIISSFGRKRYKHIGFEIKIGLLKFICDDLGLGLVDVLSHRLELHENVRLESVCPKKFLESLFD